MKALDLFCGMGGASLGLEAAGFGVQNDRQRCPAAVGATNRTASNERSDMNKFEQLVEEAEETSFQVIAMQREGPDEEDDGMTACSFVLGTDDGDAMLVTATISNDGTELSAAISTFAKGEPVDASIMQAGNSVLITSEINE